jgi:MOSC domain-containing protein YiiM
MTEHPHFSIDLLNAGLGVIEGSPQEASKLDVIVRRPARGERELIEEAVLDESRGLLGDTWLERGSSAVGGPDSETQLTIMNSRAIALIAGSKDRWPLAGDQLFIDFDLSAENLPTGSRLQIGDAIVEITAPPHLGCAKFKTRFGDDALVFVNSPTGRQLRLRGVNARIVTGGVIRMGDPVAKLVAA